MRLIVKYFKKYWFYVLIYLFFLSISFLMPPIYDDWEISQWLQYSNNNYLNLFTHNIYGSWLTFNGRAFCNIVTIFFAFFRFLWPFFIGGAFTFISFICNDYVKNHNRKITLPLTLLLLLSVSTGIRKEMYSYLCSSITFLFPFILTIIFIIFFIKSYKNFKINNLLTNLLILIFTFGISSWVENLGIGFFITLVFFNIYFYIKERKVNSFLFLSLIGSFLGIIFSLSSPGLRLTRSSYINISNFIYEIPNNFIINMKLFFYQNKIIFLTLSISSLLLLLSNRTNLRNKLLKKLILLIDFIFSFVLAVNLIFEHFLNHFGLINNIINSFLFNQSFFIIIIWFIFIIISILPAFFILENKFITKFFSFYSLAGFFPLLFIGQSGDRIISIPILAIISLTIIFVGQIDLNNKFFRSTLLTIWFFMLIKIANWFYIYSLINLTYHLHRETIQQVIIFQNLNKWDYQNDIIYLPKFKKDLVLNDGAVNYGDFHYLPMLRYYHLNEKTKVVFQ